MTTMTQQLRALLIEFRDVKNSRHERLLLVGSMRALLRVNPELIEGEPQVPDDDREPTDTEMEAARWIGAARALLTRNTFIGDDAVACEELLAHPWPAALPDWDEFIESADDRAFSGAMQDQARAIRDEHEARLDSMDPEDPIDYPPLDADVGIHTDVEIPTCGATKDDKGPCNLGRGHVGGTSFHMDSKGRVWNDE